MKQVFFLSKRFLFSRNKSSSSYFISKVSSFSIAVSSFSLIVIMSIFGGFENLLIGMYNDFDPDIKITSKNKPFFSFSDFDFSDIDLEKDNIAYSIENKVLMKYNENYFLVNLKGVSENYQNVAGILKHKNQLFNEEGKAENLVLLSYDLAKKAGVSRKNFNKNLVFYYPNIKKKLPAFSKGFNSQRGIFLDEFAFNSNIDNDFAVSNIKFVQKLLSKSNLISAIEIRVNEHKKKDEILKMLAKKNERFIIQNKYQQRNFLFKILQSERLAVLIILLMIILISSFTHIGFINMFFIEKKSEFETLKKIGLQNSKIHLTIFLLSIQKFIVGLSIGIVLAHIFIFFQVNYEIIGVGNNLIVDSYPIKYDFFVVLKLLILLLAISIIYSWFPTMLILRNFFRKN